MSVRYGEACFFKTKVRGHRVRDFFCHQNLFNLTFFSVSADSVAIIKNKFM